VATTHNFHYENIKLCLSYKKPTLVEKPIMINSEKATELFAIAKNEGIFLMEAMWTRFLPVYTHVRKWLEEKAIGEIQLVRSTLGFVARREKDDRFLNPALAGGAILDMGMYNISASQLAFKKQPLEVAATGYIGQTGVDESVSVSMHYGGGALSEFSCTFFIKPPCYLEVVGTEGSIVVNPNFIGSESASLLSNGKTTTVNEPIKINGFEYQIEEVQNQVSAGAKESNIMPLQDSFDNIKIIEKVWQLLQKKDIKPE
jgi:predicted dehydrogenase